MRPFKITKHLSVTTRFPRLGDGRTVELIRPAVLEGRRAKASAESLEPHCRVEDLEYKKIVSSALIVKTVVPPWGPLSAVYDYRAGGLRGALCRSLKVGARLLQYCQHLQHYHAFAQPNVC